jgi:hypothetical protein
MIDVSIFSSAIRTERWLSTYEAMKATNHVNFEFVFVGPREPGFALPENFKYIKTDVKPAQCSEIAARNCSGHALVQYADDIDFTPGAIDLMFEAYIKDPAHIMVSCDYWQGSVDCTQCQNILGNPNAQGWPMLPVCGLYNRELQFQLGGIDRRFNAVMWEIDILMRLWVYGVRMVKVNAICREILHGPGMCGRYWEHDRPKILEIWELKSDGTVHRKSPVLPYSDENILTISQNA